MAKTIYTQESRLGWVYVTHSDTGIRELLQVSKIIGVRDFGDSCKIKYYDPIKNCNVDILPTESFEDIAEQLGIEFEENR